MHRLWVQAMCFYKLLFGGLKRASTDSFCSVDAAIRQDFTVRVRKKRPVVDTLGHSNIRPNVKLKFRPSHHVRPVVAVVLCPSVQLFVPSSSSSVPSSSALCIFSNFLFLCFSSCSKHFNFLKCIFVSLVLFIIIGCYF